MGPFHIEQAGTSRVGESGKVAVIASWSPGTRQSLSLSALVAALQARDYGIVVSSTSEGYGNLDFPAVPGIDCNRMTIIRRANVGYDFGSWGLALDLYPEVRRAEYVILANDSLVGPFAAISAVLDDFEGSEADVWGLVESQQISRHLQSFFVGYRYGVLAEPTLREFWERIEVIPDKSELIHRYELGLSARLRRDQFTTDCFVSGGEVANLQENPMLHGWERLLDFGVPFVKRELADGRWPPVSTEAVARVVATRFGVDLRSWM